MQHLVIVARVEFRDPSELRFERPVLVTHTRRALGGVARNRARGAPGVHKDDDRSRERRRLRNLAQRVWPAVHDEHDDRHAAAARHLRAHRRSQPHLRAPRRLGRLAGLHEHKVRVAAAQRRSAVLLWRIQLGGVATQLEQLVVAHHLPRAHADQRRVDCVPLRRVAHDPRDAGGGAV
eukprot:3615677-Prymnesium_polylepis.2